MNLDKKYRPQKLSQVIGQDAIIKSINNLSKDISKFPHSFLFVGNSGTGKTTLARILASMLKVNDSEILEVDAATYTGADEMKAVAETLVHKSMFGNGRKFLILDECQMLSKAAWNSWLKIIEEPPEHLYIALCTTEAAKVPITIKTRCHVYKLNDISYNDLIDLICFVKDEEVLILPDGSEDLIATESNGSARQALVYLSQVASVSTIEEARDLIKSGLKSDATIQLCRMLVNTNNNDLTGLMKAVMLLKTMKDLNMYSLWKTIREYITSCVLSSKTERDLVFFLNLLEKTNMSRTVEFPDMILIVSDIMMNKKYF